MPDKPSILYCSSRQEWRDWLSYHFESEKEIWLAFSLKASGEKSISYNDAVEEALCFGWVDSVTGSLDSAHQLRRFTPRRKGSPYSRPNIERLIWLDANGMINPKIRGSVAELIQKPYVFPENILMRLREDETVWHNYSSFPESYRRIRVAYIDAARKRPAEFEKRLAHFIRSTRQNKLIIGYGGVEKYY